MQSSLLASENFLLDQLSHSARLVQWKFFVNHESRFWPHAGKHITHPSLLHDSNDAPDAIM